MLRTREEAESGYAQAGRRFLFPAGLLLYCLLAVMAAGLAAGEPHLPVLAELWSETPLPPGLILLVHAGLPLLPVTPLPVWLPAVLLFISLTGWWRLAFVWISPPGRMIAAASLLLLVPLAGQALTGGSLLPGLSLAVVPWLLLRADRAFRRPGVLNGILFGGVAAAGLLADLSVSLLLAGLVMAAALESRCRTLLLTPRFFLPVLLMPLLAGGAVGGLILLAGPLPPLLPDLTAASLPGGWVRRLTQGVADFSQTALLLGFPFWLAALGLLWPALRRPSRPLSDWPVITARAVAIGLLLVLLLTLGGRSGLVRPQHLVPLLAVVPMVTLATIDRIALASWRRWAFVGVQAAAALLLLVWGLL
jgi:hypothetical protein